MENGPFISDCPNEISIHRGVCSPPCLITGGYAVWFFCLIFMGLFMGFSENGIGRWPIMVSTMTIRSTRGEMRGCDGTMTVWSDSSSVYLSMVRVIAVYNSDSIANLVNIQYRWFYSMYSCLPVYYNKSDCNKVYNSDDRRCPSHWWIGRRVCNYPFSNE